MGWFMGYSSKEINNMPMEKRKQIANASSPFSLWERWGFYPRMSGGEIRVYDENNACLYRSVLQNGRWISGRASAGVSIADRVGDNISLFAHFEPIYRKQANLPRIHCDFITSVNLFLQYCERDSFAAQPRPVHIHEKGKPYEYVKAALPDRNVALKYLEKRGISGKSFDIAAKAGLVDVMAGDYRHAPRLVFKGYHDDGSVALASTRLCPPRRGSDTVEKRDLAGSDKRRPPVLHGSNSLVIVEGGVDLLSVIEMSLRLGREYPTVIATCGQNNMSWLSENSYADIVKNADRVVVVMDNDFHLSRQAAEEMADLKRRNVAALSEISAEEPLILTFPGQCKDINDYLLQGDEEAFGDIFDLFNCDSSVSPSEASHAVR